MEILKWLDQQEWVSGYEVQDFRQLESGLYYRLKINFVNQTELFVREYVDETERSYAFHWQDENHEIIVRWDNAPHHQHISTYPHHKHVATEILENSEIALADVLIEIGQRIAATEK